VRAWPGLPARPPLFCNLPASCPAFSATAYHTLEPRAAAACGKKAPCRRRSCVAADSSAPHPNVPAANLPRGLSLWNAATGRSEEDNKTHRRNVSLLTWSADGGRLLSADKGGTIVRWRVSATLVPEPVATHVEGGARVVAAVFADDASGSIYYGVNGESGNTSAIRAWHPNSPPVTIQARAPAAPRRGQQQPGARSDAPPALRCAAPAATQRAGSRRRSSAPPPPPPPRRRLSWA